MTNRSFSAIESAIDAHASFNGVAADYSQDQLRERMTEIYSGLDHAKLSLDNNGPSLSR